MKIASIEWLDQSIARYDLEVEGNSNFVAQGVVVHNSNARYVFQDDQIHCGSRTEWKKEFPSYDHISVESLVGTGKVDKERAEEIVSKLKSGAETKKKSLWWQALEATPEVRKFCEANPGVVVYGEVLGCQDLPYGLKKGEAKILVFDLMKDGRWLDPNEARTLGRDLPWVPALTPFLLNGDSVETAGMPFDFEKMCELAEGRSLVFGADNLREGIVVSPLKERFDKRVGRVKLKFVGAGYLERSK